jgi:DNA-binding response OmpR family regulator
MDGYEFTRILRETNHNLPVIMVSAKQLPEDRKKGFIAGIDDYMVKPVDMEELLLHIRALLRRSKINDEKKIIIGDVVVDSESFTVAKNGQTQELPQKEFQLLYMLLSYPNKIFTRVQIMDEIWGMDCDTNWETITVHIARLRKRFEGWQEFEIQAVRGVGYKAVRK